MIRIAVVGKIGSGKSFVAKSFELPLFDADKEVGDRGSIVATAWVGDMAPTLELTSPSTRQEHRHVPMAVGLAVRNLA